MISFNVDDAARRLVAVGYEPAWIDTPAGGYLNAIRPGSTINVLAADEVIVKLISNRDLNPPAVALNATSLQEALDFVSSKDPIDYVSAGYLAAADFEEEYLDARREEYDDTLITLCATGREYHLKHIRKTVGFEFGIDLYRFGLDGNRI